MHVAGVRLVNFRSYCDASVSFGPGLNVVVGANATGKTNLLEGAWFALRGSSPRTRREEKLILWGQRFARVEVTLMSASGDPMLVELGYAPREGKRIRWAGADVPSLDELRRRSQAGIFVPESLLLVKGSPARRRAHLDVFAVGLDRRYEAAVRDMNEALRQRNAQLGAVKGGADERTLDAWDAQFARAATALGRRRREVVAELKDRFAAAAARLSPGKPSYAMQLVSQLEMVEFDADMLLQELGRRRPGEIARGLSLFGPHRDDLRFVELGGEEIDESARLGAEPLTACAGAEVPAEGRDLRLFGSQGEQRLAVLALLLAEQALAAERVGEPGILFLDDVMSELDDTRRRLLVQQLSARGQAIVTTTNRQYFTQEELAQANVIELPLAGTMIGGESVAPNTPGASGDSPEIGSL